ncbi:histidine decarboxylase [Actinoplanes sp. NPDC051411]|uniref:histidine decarboxylase n=1 Tax=Actinoplanes sp. NPDC051411 TaxID=3155522 RepID=UPI0034213187
MTTAPPARVRPYVLPTAEPDRNQPALARLRHIADRVTASAPTNIGFPAATDIDYRPLWPLLGQLLNNVGDPQTDPLHPQHTHDLEREVLDFLAGLFRAPAGWSGYVTAGGTEGNLYGLWLARTKLPNAITYYSTATHYSVPKACRLLGLPTVEVGILESGEINYADLVHQARRYRGRPAIVVANIGTTMTEAVDDVSTIHTALDAAGITHRYIHSDAALAGIPLSSVAQRPGFDLADGADSISVSGHKFLGTPLVCGVVIARRGIEELAPHVPYLDSRDTTISGSRSGLATAMLWYALQTLGPTGLARRAGHARALANYAHRKLQASDWPAWRNPYALTVMLRRPPTDVAQRWPLPTQGDWSHLICMPGVTATQIDHLARDLTASRLI